MFQTKYQGKVKLGGFHLIIVITKNKRYILKVVSMKTVIFKNYIQTLACVALLIMGARKKEALEGKNTTHLTYPISNKGTARALPLHKSQRQKSPTWYDLKKSKFENHKKY